MDTPGIRYTKTKLKYLTHTELQQELEETPMRAQDQAFILDVHAGLTIKELAEKYNLSQSGIKKKKRRLFTQILKFDQAQAEKQR